MTESILAGASRLRAGIPCTLADEDPRAGGSHRVFKLVFQDSVVWAARENIDPSLWGMDLRAAGKLQYIKEQRPNIQAPAVFIDEEQCVTYLEWVHGEPLSTWTPEISQLGRRRFLDGLAEFLFHLWTVAAPVKFAADTEQSYSAWLTKSLDRGVRRTLNKTARWGNAIDYLVMRSMIPEYAAGLDGYTEHGFAHGDMHAENVLTTKDFELTGVVDWDWAFVAPLPAVIHHPWFLAGIPGWNNGVETSDTFAEDRAHLENAIAAKESAANLPPTVSTLLRDSGSRLFFQSAFHVKGVHERFVAMHCQRMRKNVEAARLQLDTVVRLYPELERAALELKNDTAAWTVRDEDGVDQEISETSVFI